MRREYNVTNEYDGERIDVYIVNMAEDISRSYIHNLIDEGFITVGGTMVKKNHRLKAGDNVICELPALEEPEIVAEDIPIDIIYEDDDILIINKSKGIVVHPAPGHYTGTIVNAVLYHCGDSLSGINGILRPGIVHRIDKDTSGAIVICKNDRSHRNIANQLRNHTINRRYIAIVEGILKDDEGIIDAPIGRSPTNRKMMSIHATSSKEAITHYKVIERLNGYTYIECKLETGRTHQIRVHMSSIGHPLVGDTVYGSKKDKFDIKGQALHAMVLGLSHPSTGEYMEFIAPIPQYFTELLDKLRI